MRRGLCRNGWLYILPFLLMVLHINAQSVATGSAAPPIRPLPNCFVEPVYRFVDTNQVVSNHSYRHIIAQFYNALAGVQSGGLASAGTIDPVAGTFSLNYAQEISIPKKVDATGLSDDDYCHSNGDELKAHANHSWFLSLSAGGSIISDNIGVLFNNSKFNSGANLTGKLLIPINNSVIIGGNDINSVLKKKQLIELRRWTDKRKVWLTVQSGYVDVNIIETKAKIEQEKGAVGGLRKQCAILRTKLDSIAMAGGSIKTDPDRSDKDLATRLKLADSLLSLEGQADSLERDCFTLGLKQDSLTFIHKVILDDEQHAAGRLANWALYGLRQYQKIDTFYDRLLDDVEINAAFLPYTLKWLGIVGSFNRNSYYTYDASLPFSDRIANPTLSVFNVGVELNILHYNPAAMHYFNFGLLRVRNNNIADLSTSSVTVKTVSSVVDTTQKVSNTVNAFTAPIVEYEAWNPYLNYYLFLGKEQKQGLHCSMQAEFRTTGQDPVDLGLGYIFSFKNGKAAAALNVEAYVKFQDVFKALPAEAAHFYNRNTIGLLFGVPINFPGRK